MAPGADRDRAGREPPPRSSDLPAPTAGPGPVSLPATPGPDKAFQELRDTVSWHHPHTPPTAARALALSRALSGGSPAWGIKGNTQGRSREAAGKPQWEPVCRDRDGAGNTHTLFGPSTEETEAQGGQAKPEEGAGTPRAWVGDRSGVLPHTDQAKDAKDGGGEDDQEVDEGQQDHGDGDVADPAEVLPLEQHLLDGPAHLAAETGQGLTLRPRSQAPPGPLSPQA